MKKIISFLLVVSLALIMFTGCTTSNTQGNNVNDNETDKPVATEAAKETDEANDPVEIRFAWWGDTARNDVYNAICDRFENANPGITVIREPSSWADYWDKLATQAAGGNAPDAFGIHAQYVSDYAARGALAEIQSYIDNGIIDLSKIPQGIVDSGKYNDTMYMVSQGVTYTNQLVNKTLLEKYGIDVPTYTTDYTWDAYKKLGEELTAAAKAQGNEVFLSTDNSTQLTMFRYLAREKGGDIYTEDGQLNFTQETVEEWFAYWKSLRDAALIPDAATSIEDASAPVEQKFFTKGTTAFIVAPANQLHIYQQQMPDYALSVARNPVGNDGARGEYIEGAHFAISSSTTDAKKEAAAKLINFFVNTKESMELFKLEQGVPANTEMAEYVKTLLDETRTIVIDYVSETSKIATEGTYAPIGATEINTAFSEAASEVQFDQLTPAEAAAQFMNSANAILEANK